jgi:hypothetical protein
MSLALLPLILPTPFLAYEPHRLWKSKKPRSKRRPVAVKGQGSLKTWPACVDNQRHSKGSGTRRMARGSTPSSHVKEVIGADGKETQQWRGPKRPRAYESARNLATRSGTISAHCSRIYATFFQGSLPMFVYTLSRHRGRLTPPALCCG